MVRFVEREAGLDCGLRLVGAGQVERGHGQVKIRKRKISVGLDRPPTPGGRLLVTAEVELGEAGGRQRACLAAVRNAASSETSLGSATSQRTITSLALAVLGLEEIGKVILRLWGLSEYSFGHLHKQLAVSSLLIVDAMVPEALGGRGMVDPDPAPPSRPLSPAAPEGILKAATESEAARFSQAVDAKAVDAMKQFVNRHHELTPPHSVISMVYRADRR
jgi:hypothetical protein